LGIVAVPGIGKGIWRNVISIRMIHPLVIEIGFQLRQRKYGEIISFKKGKIIRVLNGIAVF
jgi:hypothetical protein